MKSLELYDELVKGPALVAFVPSTPLFDVNLHHAMVLLSDYSGTKLRCILIGVIDLLPRYMYSNMASNITEHTCFHIRTYRCIEVYHYRLCCH